VLLANSRPRWWSSIHCVGLERIGDRIAVHDFGRGFGTEVWITYPVVVPPRPSQMPHPPSAFDNVATPPQNLDGMADMDGSWADVAAEMVATPMADLASDLVVGAISRRKSKRIVERLRTLLPLSADQRLQRATVTYASLELERCANKSSKDVHWILSGVGPRARFYVAARKRDSATVSERLASLVA
jgi:hypothetical protein